METEEKVKEKVTEKEKVKETDTEEGEKYDGGEIPKVDPPKEN
jgi:hypothetical protein